MTNFPGSNQEPIDLFEGKNLHLFSISLSFLIIFCSFYVINIISICDIMNMMRVDSLVIIFIFITPSFFLVYFLGEFLYYYIKTWYLFYFSFQPISEFTQDFVEINLKFFHCQSFVFYFYALVSPLYLLALLDQTTFFFDIEHKLDDVTGFLLNLHFAVIAILLLIMFSYDYYTSYRELKKRFIFTKLYPKIPTLYNLSLQLKLFNSSFGLIILFLGYFSISFF